MTTRHENSKPDELGKTALDDLQALLAKKNIAQTARLLGVERSTIYRWMKREREMTARMWELIRQELTKLNKS